MGLLKGTLETILCAGLILAGCSKPTEPVPKDLTQTVSVVDKVNLEHSIAGQNIDEAVRQVYHNGASVDSLTGVVDVPSSQTYGPMLKGDYMFVSTADGVEPDTVRATIGNHGIDWEYDRMNSWDWDLQQGEEKGFDFSYLTDPNPEDNPVYLIKASSLDGLTEVRTSEDSLYVKAVGNPGHYIFQLDAGSDNGGIESIMWGGEIFELSDKIAFWSYRNSNEDIYLMNPDGTEIQRLTTNPTQDIHPDWSYDGSQIAFTSNRSGNLEVYIMNANGTNQRSITSGIERAMQPEWTSDGKILFNYKDSGLVGIARINPDGTGFTRLVEESYRGYLVGNPSCSPDRSKIAFDTYRDGNWEVYIMNANGTNQTNITNNPSHDVQPEWSPDGSKIAFISNRSTPGEVGEFDLYLINPDGSNIWQLTNALGREMDASWSYDGSQIAFTRVPYVGADYQIYKMDSDGTNWVQLTFQGENRFPAFRLRNP